MNRGIYMKKIELKNLLDEYEEKASWAYMFGHCAPEEITELHKICDEELVKLNDNEEIPLKTIQHIDDIASHYTDQWTDIASETLREIEYVIHKNH